VFLLAEHGTSARAEVIGGVTTFVAPHVGENRLHRVRALGVTWQQRLSAVVLGGVVFPLISFAGPRTWLANAVLWLLYDLFGLPR
jgi:xanthine/uracil/vitamin C permease (AzgA family)